MAARTYRIETDSGLNSGQFLIDSLTRKSPTFINGSAVDLDFGCFQYGDALDLSTADDVVLRIIEKEGLGSESVLTRIQASINSPFTKSGWETGTDVHFTFSLSTLEMTLGLDGADFKDFILHIVARTGATESVLGYSEIRVLHSDLGDIEVSPYTWGTITGTLSDQADLQQALDDASSASGSAVLAPPGITGLTGGTPNDLDSLTTDVGGDYTVNAAVLLFLVGGLQAWRLESGTDAENVAGGIVRPDDYAITDNEKVWKRYA